MAARVWEAIEYNEIQLPAMNDVILLVVLLAVRSTEYASFRALSRSNVLVPPGAPDVFHIRFFITGLMSLISGDRIGRSTSGRPITNGR
jgi:hypothetical protein